MDAIYNGSIFYFVKPLLPRRVQLFLRRIRAQYKRTKYATTWPIDERAAKKPGDWKGWPDGKQFALVLQHDVDTQVGHDKIYQLMDLEEKLGVRSIFYIVPERYPLSMQLLKDIKNRGFGLGIHGLKHDGKLFLSYDVFKKNAARINEYMNAWGVKAFSSPSMHHNLEWMHHIDMETSTSTFDTDPFEPQPDAICSIFPFVVKNDPDKEGFVELPYTLPQDFTLFIILREKTIDIWKKKIDWVISHNGMALLNTHPDYMDFTNGRSKNPEAYPVRFYSDFVNYIKAAYQGKYWEALPEDIAVYLKSYLKRA